MNPASYCEEEKHEIYFSKDAVLHPVNRFQLIEGKRRWSHGVQTLEDIPWEFGNLSRYGECVVDTNLRDNKTNITSLPGTWMYGGILFDHFGHFFSESAHRLWAWDRLKDKVDGIVFLTVANIAPGKLPKYVKEYLTLLGIPFDKVKLERGKTKVECLYLPKPGSQIGVIQPSWYVKGCLKGQFENWDIDTSQSRRNIFLSRRNFLGSGKVSGLTFVEQVLEARGFDIVFPETESLADQIMTIKNADTIVWEEGSNIHLLDVMPAVAAKSFLFKRRRRWTTFDKILEQKTIFKGSYSSIKPLPKSFGESENQANRKRLSVCSDIPRLFEFTNEILRAAGYEIISDYSVFQRNYLSASERDCKQYESEFILNSPQ